MSALISMKMSASWEAEKSASNAVPRLCSLSLAQIILDRPLEPDSPNSNFFVAVRMRGSGRRVLRSPEINLVTPKAASPVNGLTTSGFACSTADSSTLPFIGTSVGAAGSVLIDFNCNIQYSHLLNRDANVLQILLQRRKKYKNKTMNFGYKTLAYCSVNLTQVLQRRIENRFLELYTDPKCLTQPIGRIEVQSLSTIPIEKELLNGKRKALDEDEEYPLPDTYSEDSDHGEDSDDDAIAENDDGGQNRQKKLVRAMSVGQKQIKQKLMGLLKKLKMGDPNEEDLDVGENSKLWDEFDLIGTVSDIEEEDSDVDGADSVSIQSTPKPMLRPFFATIGGSDETLGADAGTKLLKRLQRQLFTQPESDVPVDASYPGSTSPPPSAAHKPIDSVSSKKTLPTSESSHLIAPSVPLVPDARDSRSSLRHHRGPGLSGGRLAKRFAHMGRRSNVTRADKQFSLSVPDAVKPSEHATERKSLPLSTLSISQNPSLSERPNSPTFPSGVGTMSYQAGESSDDSVNAMAPCHHRSGLKGSGSVEVTSSALGDDAVVLGTSTSSGRCQFPCSPSETSTPDSRVVLSSPSELLASHTFSASAHTAEKQLAGAIDSLGNVIFLANPLEPGGKLAAEVFSGRDLQLQLITSYGEMKQLFARLVTKSQSQNRRASDCDLIRVCVLGGDVLVSFALRAYVDQLSSRSPEMAASFRFYVIPVTGLLGTKSASLTHAPPESVLQVGLPQQQRRSAAVRDHGNNPTPVRHEPLVADQSTVDSDPRTAITSSAIGSPPCTHNTVASYLCKIDPTYAALFSEFCSSWSGSCGVENSPASMTDSPIFLRDPLSSLNLFERVAMYLHHGRSVISMPIGSCLLGTASALSVGSKLQKSTPLAEHPAQLSYTTTSGHLDSSVTCTTDGVAKFSSAALSEELLMPFLISVTLGSDPVPRHISHLRPGTGIDSTMANVSATNTSDLGSVVSDPEGSFATTKRSQSPDTFPPTAAVSPQAYSTTTSNANLSPCSRLWDLQLEYWVLPSGGSSLGSTGTGPSTGPSQPVSTSGSSAHPTLSLATSTPTQLSTDIAHPRRVTMKSICRGLLITLGSTPIQHSTTRGGESHSSCADAPSTPVRSSAPPASCSGPDQSQRLLSLAVWSKEKKQKIMRLGRRGKDCSGKFEMIEGIQRLLCTGRGIVGSGATSISVERSRESEGTPTTQGLTDVGSLALESLSKSSASLSLSASSSYHSGSGINSMLRVSVDGVEWVGLRFFQITSTWRTHIKSFPLCSFSVGRVAFSHANDSSSVTTDSTAFPPH